jgi:hypothetical protein
MTNLGFLSEISTLPLKPHKNERNIVPANDQPLNLEQNLLPQQNYLLNNKLNPSPVFIESYNLSLRAFQVVAQRQPLHFRLSARELGCLFLRW